MRFPPPVTERVLQRLHYPVARAAEHYYPNHEDEIDHLLRMVRRHWQRDGVVLDLGCGRLNRLKALGQSCRLLAGLDISPAIAENTGMDCKVRASVSEMPFVNGCVDVVVSSYLLEHLERPTDALREVARVLRPGGKFVLLTPNQRHYVCLVARWTPHRFHRWFLARHGRFGDDVCRTHYRANTPRRLREIASQAGLRLIELETREGPPAYLAWFWLAFLLGVAYERIVNRFEALAGLRVTILATLEKPA